MVNSSHFIGLHFFSKYTILVKVTPTVTPSSNRVDSRQAWFFSCGKSFCGSQIVQLLSKYDQLPVTYKVMETTKSCVTYKGVHVANNTVASSNPCTRKKKKKKNLVDKKTASVSPLLHPAVKKKESYPESLQNFGMYLDYSRTKKGGKKTQQGKTFWECLHLRCCVVQ